MQYVDLSVDAFDTEQVRGPDGSSWTRFKVRVLDSPVGETDAVSAEYDDDELGDRLIQLEMRGLDRAGLIALGRSLAQLLLPSGDKDASSSVREMLRRSLIEIGPDCGLRLRLRLPPMLAVVPWEYMYLDRPGRGDGMDGFLALDPRVAIVRHEIVDAPRIAPEAQGSIKVLVSLASAGGLTQLDLQQERADLEQALAGQPGIETVFLEQATMDAIQGAIPGTSVFHYAGHGVFERRMGDLPGTYTGTGALALCDGNVDAEQIGINLRSNQVQLAVLGGCETGRRDGISVWSGIAPALVKAEVPAVVANQYSISDVCAIAFSRQFYRALVGGLSIERAVAAGRIAAYNADKDGRDWGVPVLYMRAGDGQLFAGASDEAVRDQARVSTEADIEKGQLAQGIATLERGLQAQADRATGIPSGNPYKELLAYDLADAGLFFGRGRALDELIEHLDNSPLTVLQAEPGAGKTSLLRGGLLWRLIQSGHLPVYCGLSDRDPVLAIKQAFLPDIEDLPHLAELPLNGFFRRIAMVCGSETMLCVLLDRFERFFTLLDEARRHSFVDQLAECLEDVSLDVRWVLAIRAESLWRLARYSERIAPFRNVQSLKMLARSEAREAIVRPVALQGVRFEETLVETLLDTLGQGEDEIAPAQVQLVCSALFKDLNPGDKEITSAQYTALGGHAKILGDHLDRVLTRDLLEHRRAAARLLVALTDGGRLARRTHRELAAELGPSGVTEEELDVMLRELVNSRLLRIPEEGREEHCYELAHSSLLEKVEFDPDVQALKAAQALLEREMLDYEAFRGTSISAERLDFITAYPDYLILDADRLDLLLRSALAHGRSPEPWRGHAVHRGLIPKLAARWIKVLEAAEGTDEAVQLLAWLPEAEVVSQLAALLKPSPALGKLSDVQCRALAALAQLECPEAEAWLRKWSPPEFCLVPAGWSQVGSRERLDEQPVHRVWLPAFWLAVAPVTVADWRRFILSGGYAQARYWPGAVREGETVRCVPQVGWPVQQAEKDHPVRNLTWYEAMAYAAWFAEEKGLPADLPTEVEWEKAAGWDEEQGRMCRFPWGDEFHASCCTIRGSDDRETTPVGSHSPAGDSSYGAQDMAGNVLEWTRTEYRTYPYDAQDGREEPSSEGYRVLRGGAFNRDVEEARCARRHALDPAIGLNNTGCRLCVRLAPLAAVQCKAGSAPGVPIAGKKGVRPTNEPAPG